MSSLKRLLNPEDIPVEAPRSVRPFRSSSNPLSDSSPGGFSVEAVFDCSSRYDVLDASLDPMDWSPIPYSNGPLQQDVEMTTPLPYNHELSNSSPVTPRGAQSMSLSAEDDTVEGGQNAQDHVCYGMLYRVDVKLIGDMTVVDAKLVPAGKQALQPIQRFKVADEQNQVLLTFQDEAETQFGYLRIGISRCLIALIENSVLQLEAVAETAVLRETIGRAHKASEALVRVNINIYGPRSEAKKVGKMLSEHKQWLQIPDMAKPDIPYENPQNLEFPGLEDAEEDMRDSQNNTSTGCRARKPTKDLQKMMEEVYASLKRGRHLEAIEAGTDLKTELLDHQKEGLDFLRQRETGQIPDEYRLWQKEEVDGETIYLHKITSARSSFQPDEKGGGILADEMGMGKSLSILSQAVTTLNAAIVWARERNNEKTQRIRRVKRYTHATLIVVPSVLLISTWMSEIEKHIGVNMKAIRFHGARKDVNFDKIEDTDVVITTYNTLAAEFTNGNSILHEVGWYRVVLDEAHFIRQQETAFHRSCADLTAHARWCLTGTPIQNRLDDIGALFAFLRVPPFHSHRVFRKYVTSPFEDSSSTELEISGARRNLVNLLESFCLRRTRDEIRHEVPEPREIVKVLEFTDAERLQYEKTIDILERSLKVRVGEFERHHWGPPSILSSQGASSHGISTQFGLFQVHLQLRILCNHGTFQQPFSWQRHLRDFREEREINLGSRSASIERFCHGCGAQMPVRGNHHVHNSFVERCSHVMCRQCLADTEAIDARDGFIEDGNDGERQRRCPLCRRFGETVDEGEPREDDDRYFNKEGYSTKMVALIQDVKRDLNESKSIIFSCWTHTLNLVARHLDQHGIKFKRIDGNSPARERQDILKRFSKDDKLRVLIMTTGTGALGLNLTCANRVFIVELQWNSSVENQAVSRAIRIGQGKEVLVTKYCIKDTVEEVMRQQQGWKRKLAEVGFSDSATTIVASKPPMSLNTGETAWDG